MKASNRNSSPYERVMKVLRGEPSESIPFTSYEIFVPMCTFEREIRNRGL